MIFTTYAEGNRIRAVVGDQEILGYVKGHVYVDITTSTLDPRWPESRTVRRESAVLQLDDGRELPEFLVDGWCVYQEQTPRYALVLTSAGERKLDGIKAVRRITGLGLKDAQLFVEGAPREIKGDITKFEAESIRNEITDAGGFVEIKEC